MKVKIFFTYVASALIALAMVGNSRAASNGNSSPGGDSLRFVELGAQSPSPAAPGGKGLFPVTVTRAGSGSFKVYLRVDGLPQGATGAFIPPEIAFSDQGPSTKTAVLVINLDPNTAAGSYLITLVAQHGASPVVLASTSLLVVNSEPVVLPPPRLDPPVLNPDGTVTISGSGTASQPVLVQATANLLAPDSWETIGVFMLDEGGLFSVIDVDAANYPIRFYRAAQ